MIYVRIFDLHVSQKESDFVSTSNSVSHANIRHSGSQHWERPNVDPINRDASFETRSIDCSFVPCASSAVDTREMGEPPSAAPYNIGVYMSIYKGTDVIRNNLSSFILLSLIFFSERDIRYEPREKKGDM